MQSTLKRLGEDAKTRLPICGFGKDNSSTGPTSIEGLQASQASVRLVLRSNPDTPQSENPQVSSGGYSNWNHAHSIVEILPTG